jgi:hypothetical protein
LVSPMAVMWHLVGKYSNPALGTPRRVLYGAKLETRHGVRWLPQFLTS